MLLVLLAGIVAAAVTQRPAAAPRAGVVLRADAGLGGFARPGRWTPVRVEIENADRDLTGEVVIEWGDARLHRAVELAAPSRTSLELYVRTGDARGSMSVRLIAGDAVLASVDAPIRVIADDEHLVVCAGRAAPASDGALPCTATTSPQALPRSMRGYLAADDVRLQPGAEAQLAAPQRTALQRWRAYHELDADGSLSLAPHAPLGAALASGPNRPAVFAGATAVAAMLCAFWIWSGDRGSAMRRYLALAAAVLIGTLAATMAGRVGPGSEIEVRHATTVQQVGDGSIVTMRGSVEYPAADTFALRVPRLDGSLTARADVGAQWLDAEGTPVRRGAFGRGAHEQVELDGVVGYAPFLVTATGDVVRVANRSDATLTDCAFPEGFSQTHAGDLAPGAAASARPVALPAAAFFSCRAAAPPVTIADARYRVRMEGPSIVSVRLPAPAPVAVIE